jgi:PAS domain-containing serine/threonine kinase
VVPKEVMTLQACNHPNIIKFHDSCESPDKHFIIMEYFGDSVDLFQFIDDHPNMEEPLARIIFRQLAEAIAYCHHNRIAHRNIKEENVLINQSLQLRLIDFGSATFLEKAGDKEFKLFFGTLEYASPEVLSGNNSYIFD